MRYSRDLDGQGEALPRPGPSSAAPPSQMSREAFVLHFGGVFEHSAWIAERAHETGLVPANDTAHGLHAALTTVFRAATEAERLAVLRAHPDLAGKLAAARRLTPSSQGEQAHAGLDTLTDKERTRFAALNARYLERFGFPFVLAVRGHDRHAILAAFEARMGHDGSREFHTACHEVERIALLRLEAVLPH